MLITLSRIYVYILAALLSLLLALLLTIHVTLLFGDNFPIGGRLFAVFFAINMPTLGLAEHRNIGAHELKTCPRWFRIAFPLLFIYSFAMMLLGVAFTPPISPSNWDVAISGFMFMFSVASSFVLYVTMKTAQSNEIDLLARTKRSLIGTAIMAAFALFALLASHRTPTT